MKKQALLKTALVAALFTQVSHSAHVFASISSEKNDVITPYVFAFAIELSIYVFAMYGKRTIATYFALASFLTNVLYYWKAPGMTFDFVAMLVLSCLVPAIIWFYSELIKEQTEQAKIDKAEEARKTVARAKGKAYRERKKAEAAAKKSKRPNNLVATA